MKCIHVIHSVESVARETVVSVNSCHGSIYVITCWIIELSEYLEDYFKVSVNILNGSYDIFSCPVSQGDAIL